MVRINVKKQITKKLLGGGRYLSNHTITRKINKHEIILENPSF